MRPTVFVGRSPAPLRRNYGVPPLSFVVMQPDPTIRKAEPGDAACLAALAAQSWLHTYATQGIRQSIARYVHEHLTPEAFRLSFQRSDAATYVTELNGHLVAYAVLEIDKPCPARDFASTRLDKLYVQEHFLGRGIGFRLLELARSEARRRSEGSGMWLTVNSLNKRARAFYERQGFEDIGFTYFDLYDEKHENRILHAPAA